jgi:hydroxyethylthiazole kinase-like uncharacterized protein yjeF
MKILSSIQIKEADAYTMEHEPIASIDLMERASNECTLAISKLVPTTKNIHIFCGVGNNGGDGLAIGRQLASRGYHVVCYGVVFSSNPSKDFETNKQRLVEQGIPYISIKTINDIPKITSDSVIIDAIFGSGINKPVNGIAKDVILAINQVNPQIIAIDIPSGLFCEDNDKNDIETVINASVTLTFENPKLSFFLPESAPKVGRLAILNIGLNEDFISNIDSKYFALNKETVKNIHKGRAKYSHKGTYGHVKIIAGSYGKIGAAILASEACLRSGTGLLTVHLPSCGYQIIQERIPEAMVETNSGEKFLEGDFITSNKVIGMGPGIGTNIKTQEFIHQIIIKNREAMVIDADALNIISKHPDWIDELPPNCILTPHPKEFERLVGKWNGDMHKLELLIKFSATLECVVVLKGANTAIALPNGKVFFNTSGNPGMATAGSGDALTGILTGLLAQGYSSKEAALLGVFVHGMAGDLACKELGMEAMIAGDIISKLGEAFTSLYPAP